MPELSDNGEVLRFLAASVESVRLKVDRIDERTEAIEGRVANIEGRVVTIEGRMATIEGRVATIESRMATKDDITMVRGDIERLDLRLDAIDRGLTIRLDTTDLSISRLRSAVYLLAKDQPEILKLLGQA
jgi:glycine cleavage system regulatory protein